MKIRVYKRQENKTKMAVKKAEEILSRQDVRVHRPGLLEFMVGGGFAKLPITPQTVMDSHWSKRDPNAGFVVPLDSLGRKVQQKIDQATENGKKKLSKKAEAEIFDFAMTNPNKESVREWIAKNLPQFGIDPASVSVVVDPDHFD